MKDGITLHWGGNYQVHTCTGCHALHGARVHDHAWKILHHHLWLLFTPTSFPMSCNNHSQDLEDLDERLAAIEAGDSGDYLDQV